MIAQFTNHPQRPTLQARVHDELRHQIVGNVALAVIQRECINMRCNLA